MSDTFLQRIFLPHSKEIEIPADSEILTVEHHDRRLCMWIRYKEETTTKTVEVLVIGGAEDNYRVDESMKFIGAALQSLVFIRIKPTEK